MPLNYHPIFSEAAVGCFVSMNRRRRRVLLDRARELASDPHLTPDYTTEDTDGRRIAHLLVGDFVFTYWVDDAERRVFITEIDHCG